VRRCNTDSLRTLARDAFDAGAQEILMQAWGETAEEMVAVGRQLASLDPRINIKIPITKEGVEVRSSPHRQFPAGRPSSSSGQEPS
jgi:transaldolase